MVQASSESASWIYRLAWLFYLALALAAALWLGLRQGRIGVGLFIARGSWWIDLGLGLVTGTLLILVWLLARRLLSAARNLETELAEMLGPMGTSEILSLALLSGFSEELFFRGAMQGAWGWFPATVLFALLHAGPGTTFKVWTAFAGVAGLTMAGLMIWRGNLLAPVVTHVLVNAVNLGRLSRLSDDLARVPNPAD